MHAPMEETGLVGSPSMDAITPKNKNKPRRNRKNQRLSQSANLPRQTRARPYGQGGARHERNQSTQDSRGVPHSPPRSQIGVRELLGCSS